MKSFLVFIAKILLLLLLVAVALDFVYTTVFAASENRNKVEKVINSKPQNYDVIILGTSRANNHFVPELFEQQGLKTFNYGMSGSHLFEASLLLKLMVERGWDIKQILLETDLNLSNEKRDPGTSAWMMPFLHRSETIREHYYKEPDFNQLYYIPFYRYIEFDNRIGFRALWKTATQQPTVFLKNQGYYPLPNTSKGNMKNNIKALRPLRNRYYEEIKDICRKNNIQLIAVTTPMCENTEGMEYFSKVKQLYPEIREYEQAVQGDEYFSSCGHLNDRGARKFTEIIINDLLKKK
ncbi:hypothetical protein NAT50_06875 [Flavobacterium sp. HXWNR70]|uniref:SGNH/GDSL hydrolase family protein n=1 Tax=Flavobacterium luminosum TaxID=2949086 RepID=A0ABT0TNL0_9FLAO|nr:hypothetical protein [Flavobacterium sp. HXWNR70]MCL9809078.1 hypothetical protein [Flavobacterium sp. HXWNR70]